ALLAAWPLAALLRGGGLGAALGLSAVAGVCVVALWRSWPLWRASAREGGTLGAHWQALDARDASGWHGLGAAACVAAILGSILLLAWPGLLGPQARWAVAGAALVAWPLLHLLLQRLPEPPLLSRPIPVVDMEGEPSSLAAARAGRVDQALALLEAGADAHGLPLEDERDQRPLAVLAAVLPDLRLLRALIAAGVDVNAAHGGLTPLLAATRDSWHGRPEAV